jgi:thiamine biosynthesis lipoprotein
MPLAWYVGAQAAWLLLVQMSAHLLMTALAVPSLAADVARVQASAYVPAHAYPAALAARTASDAVRVSAMRYLMGTFASATVFAADSVTGMRAVDAALDEIAELESMLTEWHAGGDIARLNAAGDTKWVTLNADAWAALDRALYWARASSGAFDPTVRPLVRLWGFRRDEPHPREPSAHEIKTARALVDYRRIVRADGRRVRFTRRGMNVDLGGIGKGYALDCAAACLDSLGVHRALLDLGGQVLALDPPPGLDGWPVLIADPRGADRSLAALSLRRASASTSSQAERFVERNGARVGHILDPRTGRASTRTLCATIVAPRAVDADALSTTAFVLGPHEALKLLARDPVARAAEALLLGRDGRIYRTPGLRTSE